VDPIGELAALFAGRRLFVLVGAGCSTESGIPDYRGPKTQRLVRNPVQYRAFVSDPIARRRYWARSAVGWRAITQAQPNPAHHALARIEQEGLTPGIVTQNVDGLHQRAGSRSVVELHGALREVCCLDCGALEAREVLQRRIEGMNPDLQSQAALAPDGDAELDPGESFVVPSCERCGGMLKPNVVFFGENVPRPRVEACYSWLGLCDALLVVGSSLTVFSGYRFVKRASERGLPIGIVNLGPTRAQPLATLHVDGPAGQLLPALVERLAGYV
jgi:NAD-dependent deacetylase sirtuin 4